MEAHKAKKSVIFNMFGQHNLQNHCFMYILKNEFNAEGAIYATLDEYTEATREEGDQSDKRITIVLIDCTEQSFEEIMKTIALQNNLTDFNIIAIFNLNRTSGIEKRIIQRNIKGFFYKDDTLPVFLKGIRHLLDGEVWLSRKILLQKILEDQQERIENIQKSTSLTQREIEILSLIQMGATNKEIARKMFVSTHTVKTHLYNIYKKIRVKNRFSAALWAERNL